MNALEYTDDGQLLRIMSGSKLSMEASIAEGEHNYLIVDEIPANTYAYVEEGELVSMPPPPNDWHNFDYKIKKWVPNMELGKELTKARIQKQYEEASLGGFEWGGVSLASDRDSQVAIQMAVSLGGESAELAMVYGACHMVESKKELQAVGKALLDHLTECVRRRAEALQRVNDATTVGELEAIEY